MNRQSATAPAWCTREAWDANEHARNLTDWSQQYDQFGQGGFYGRIDEIRLPQMQIFKEYTSQALNQQCHVWPEALWIGIPANHLASRINGHRLEANDVMCQPGSRDFELTTPDAFTIYGLVVRRDWLAMVAGDAACSLMESDPQRLMRLQIPERIRQSTAFVIERLLTHKAASLEIKVHQDILGLALQEIVREEVPNTRHPPSYPHRRQVVDRIKACLAEAETPPASLEELCAIAHVSQRTLRYSFTSILGISPTRFVRLMRLNRVRRCLCSPDATTSVSQVAEDWGFYHHGQFSRDYRRLFGELPSVTLGRHHT